MTTSTNYRCPECDALCVESSGTRWLICPRCSRIGTDFKPPDPFPDEAWDFPAADGVEMALPKGSFSLIEHAIET
jgi:DNA-directed RNA polymerase subunit RPC12/RpoP